MDFTEHDVMKSNGYRNLKYKGKKQQIFTVIECIVLRYSKIYGIVQNSISCLIYLFFHIERERSDLSYMFLPTKIAKSKVPKQK